MHSKGDMFIRIPALELICTGDAVVEHQTTYFHGADIRGWIYSLQLLAGMNGKLILAGHSPELLPYSYITEFSSYLSVIEKCARICFMRFHPELLDKIEEERFANVTTDEVRELVDQFFPKGAKTRFSGRKGGSYRCPAMCPYGPMGIDPRVDSLKVLDRFAVVIYVLLVTAKLSVLNSGRFVYILCDYVPANKLQKTHDEGCSGSRGCFRGYRFACP
jgi:hypothetical protein